MRSIAAARRPHVPSASLSALALAGLAEVAAVAIVMNVDSDPSGIRWWLVLLPVILAAAPVLFPTRSLRITAAAALVAWCAVAAASIGLFFVPATMAALVATRERDAA